MNVYNFDSLVHNQLMYESLNHLQRKVCQHHFISDVVSMCAPYVSGDARTKTALILEETKTHEGLRDEDFYWWD